MRWIFFVWLVSALPLSRAFAEPPAEAFVEVDCRQVRHPLIREPKYAAQPRYALFVMDPAGEFRTWAVLDKSAADLPHYDVVFFDIDGDGDLTEPGERFIGDYDPKAKSVVIRIGNLAVPRTQLVHTDLRFLTTESHGYKGVYMMMKWNGEHEVSGGLGHDGTLLTTYAATAADAPVLRPTPLGLLSLMFFTADVTIKPDRDADIQVGIGKEGSGGDTFCVLSEHFLQPGKDRLVATVIAHDRDGREVRTRQEIDQHC
jgi:hypothetical protein